MYSLVVSRSLVGYLMSQDFHWSMVKGTCLQILVSLLTSKTIIAGKFELVDRVARDIFLSYLISCPNIAKASSMFDWARLENKRERTYCITTFKSIGSGF